MSRSHPPELPVAVIGAGPVGLAAAAHCVERDLPFLVFEQGDRPAAAVAEWQHVQLFSPWRYTIDAAARRLLATTGWIEPDPDVLPTGAELREAYLRPLAAHPRIAPHIRYGARVEAIARAGVDRVRTEGRESTPFVIRVRRPDDDGFDDVLARAVIDASGTWYTPNVLGANGLPAPGEEAAAAHVDHALPDVLGADRDRFAGRHTVVVGSGHSAATTLLALASLAADAPGTQITWAIRRSTPDAAFGGGSADALPARGALGTGLRHLVTSGRVRLVPDFRVARVCVEAGQVVLESDRPEGPVLRADRVVAATGCRPDLSLTSELRLDLDPILSAPRALAPLIDPNLHSCGTVRPHGADELSHPEPGYFAVGTKSYGRAPTFLLATGYEQARSVVAALDGDWEAARDVRLELPETGVCQVTTAYKELAVGLGLTAEQHTALLGEAAGRLESSPDARSAVLTAATELGIASEVAHRIATFVADQVDPQPTTSQGCCG